MLTVTSISPDQNETGVYTDANIQITFSDQLHSSSISPANFILYLADWTGSINVAINHHADDKRIVTLIPSRTLDPNTQYAIWIQGDKNLVDSELKGVVDINANPMDGHYISYFATGDTSQESQDIVDQIGPYNPGEGLQTSAEEQEIILSNGVLDILRTIPADESTEVQSISQIQAHFDQPIVFWGDETTDITIEATSLIFGETASIPTIDTVEPISNKLYINTTGDISENTEYTVTMYMDVVSGLPPNPEQMVGDYSFTFTSNLWPLYSSVYLVRKRGRALVPSSLSNGEIERYILDASLWAQEVTGFSYSSGEVPPIDFVTLVTCKAIYDIGEAVSAGSMIGIKQKRLADLSITYDRDGISKLLDKFEDCMNSALLTMGFNVRSQIGVKSRFAELRPYPGAKRLIHQYNRKRFLTDKAMYRTI